MASRWANVMIQGDPGAAGTVAVEIDRSERKRDGVIKNLGPGGA